jgi:hypothetical protein
MSETQAYFVSPKAALKSRRSGSSECLAALCSDGATRSVDANGHMDYTPTHPPGQTRYSVGFGAANRRGIRDADIERNLYLAEGQTAAGNADSTPCLAQARHVQADWDLNNITYQRKRKSLTDLVDQLKVLMMTTKGGPYNFQEQMEECKHRIMRDFGDAYARMLAARDDLTNIYEQDIPGFPDLNVVTNVYPSLDQSILWTRQAIRYLVAFGHRDQTYVASTSVRSLVGNAAYTQAIQNPGAAGVSFSFEIPQDRFADQVAVRLRGVYLYVVTSKPAGGTWNVTFRPPLQGWCRFRDDQTGTGHILDQSSKRVYVFGGRVMSRDSERDADLLGSTVLRNLSPLGAPTAGIQDCTWSLTLSTSSSAQESVNIVGGAANASGL